MIKRIFDVLISSGSLIILAIPMLLLSLLIRLQMGSPVLFVQLRPGLNGKPFKIIKFRTMKNAKDKFGRMLPDEKRITRLGAFLRKSSLDELPELWNVLRGDMSLVGPRPLLMEYLPLYSARQRRRHEAKPGITGWAQINGRNAIAWQKKFALDVWYVGGGVIEWWGYRNDIPIVFANSFIVVLPSYREGFSKVITESAACGRAVITSDVPGCRDAVELGVTGLLVPVRDIKALAAAIRLLLDNPSLCEEMGRAGRKLAECSFDIKKVVSQHMLIYDELFQHTSS